MDKNKMFNAIDRFLADISQNGKSDVKCPFCGKPLEYIGSASAYEVTCHTSNCTKESFRGI